MLIYLICLIIQRAALPCYDSPDFSGFLVLFTLLLSNTQYFITFYQCNTSSKILHNLSTTLPCLQVENLFLSEILFTFVKHSFTIYKALL